MKKGIAAVLSAVMVFASMYVGLSTVIGVSAATDIDFTYVDFDGASAGYYADNTDYRAYWGTVIADTGDEHGKAMKITKFAGYGDEWPYSLALSAADGQTRFYVEEGAQYTFTYDYCIKKKVEANIQFAAKIVPENAGANNRDSVRTASENGSYVYASWANMQWADENKWLSAENQITAPCDGTVLLVPFGGEWADSVNGLEILIDNIKLEKNITRDGSTVDVTYDHNYDGVKEVKATEVGGAYKTARRSGYSLAGRYLDPECTIPAPSTARSSCTTVYAKWDAVEPYVNTYDDAAFENVTLEDGSVKTYFRGDGSLADNTADNEFGVYGTTVENITLENGETTNVLHFSQAKGSENIWTGIGRLYNNRTMNPKFAPKSGAVYEISFKYRVNQEASEKLFLQIWGISGGIGNANGGYSAANVYANNLINTDDVTDGWVEASAVFNTNSESSLCFVLTADTWWGNTVAADIDIDDVRLVERTDVYTLTFETNGAGTMAKVNCLPNEELPVFNTPHRDGYAFTGWYTDAALTKPFDANAAYEDDMTLYAGWTSLENMPESLNTGFEKEEYQTVPYTNDGTRPAVSDNSMTASAEWRHDAGEAYEGNSYIAFDDGADSLTDSNSGRYMAVSLYNPDGTPFCVTEGKRYKVSLAYRHMGEVTNSTMEVCLYITDQTPGAGINKGNATALLETGTIGADKHDAEVWGEYSIYTAAAKTGPVKLAMWCSSLDQTLDVDNVKIELMSESECVKVEYIQQNEKGEGQYSSGVRYGAPGDLLIAGQSSHIDGYAFNGWRTADGELYSSNRFPSSDLTLYASWRVADNADDAAPNPKEEFLLDFEDTDRAKAFYEDSANNYHPENGVFLTVNDPDNAHSGNNYFQFYQCGHWMEEYLRRFKLYDPDTVGNQVYLEPNSVYKVSFWLNIESVGAGNLYLCTFPDRNSMTEYEVQNENYITDTNSFENFGKWVLYENTVITGDDEDGDGIAATLGFTFYGGYLTAKLDDISIIKLKEVTVSFESNGGSDVNDITQLSYDYAIAPADPEREGYTFTGWYTDEKLTQRFNFKTELITKDIKLYAGWKVADTQGSQNTSNEKEPIYNTVIDYEKVEQTVDVEVPDKELDEQLTFADTDKVGKINKQNASTDASDGSPNLVWIIIAIAGGVVLVAAAAVVTVMVVKKRKRRN